MDNATLAAIDFIYDNASDQEQATQDLLNAASRGCVEELHTAARRYRELVQEHVELCSELEARI